MNINILRYSLFGIAGRQEVDHTFVKKQMMLANFAICAINKQNFISIDKYLDVFFKSKCNFKFSSFYFCKDSLGVSDKAF